MDQVINKYCYINHLKFPSTNNNKKLFDIKSWYNASIIDMRIQNTVSIKYKYRTSDFLIAPLNTVVCDDITQEIHYSTAYQY